MSVVLYVPTVAELNAFKKSDLVEEFCILKGNDYTGGHEFFAWMFWKQLLDAWHITALAITLFAIIGGYTVEGDAWSFLFLIPYLAYWIGSYVTWRKKKKGSNPKRDLNGMSLSEFAVRSFVDSRGWPRLHVVNELMLNRHELYQEADRLGLLTDPIDEKFWRWLELNW